jgi:glycosyltransferase involved in cell wall biosynthesis
MKALVIAPQPFFTPRGTPMSVYYRTLVMAKNGIDVDLLTYGEGKDAEIPRTRIIRIPRFRIFGNVKTGPSVLKIFLDVFVSLWTVGLLIRHRYDFVHAHEEAVFIALILKPIFRFKLVYDMHSSLPEQLRNFGWSNSSVLRKVLIKAENKALNRADAVITICPVLADYATARIEDASKHFLIENSIFWPVRLKEEDSSTVETFDVEGMLAPLHASDDARTFLYAGTLESYQGIDLLLESMAIAVREQPNIRLVIVGGSASQVDHYAEMAAQLGIADFCCLHSRVPQQAAKELVARCDVIVSPRSDGMNTPLKIYELLDSGKPLVATRILSHTQVLNDDVAFLGDPKPQEFAEQMLLSVTDDNQVSQKVAAARRLYVEEYAPDVYAKKIGELLRRLS